MLKIKDFVDLKELEKFGFDFNNNTGKYVLIERNVHGKTGIFINTWDKKILFKQEVREDYMCLEILYDLIKSDLVEKVEE